MPTPDMSVWKGRVDAADGPNAVRWHQRVQPLTPGCHSGVALVGFACDEGVRRNGGRVGARDAPPVVRKALANLAWHHDRPVYDAGDEACDGNLEDAQDRLADAIAEVIAGKHRPLVIGGGHETAWGTFQGIKRAKPRARVGVINIDAHFDLRGDVPANSGTPFAQIARWYSEHSEPFRYFALGVSQQSNTAALFDKADSLGVVYQHDFCLAPWELDQVHQLVEVFARPCDAIHLSIDLDVLPASVMPAVSAPASGGVQLEAVERLMNRTLALGKTVAVDIVEFNPSLDLDGRGAKVAARLAWHAARNWR
ncbi:MAG TPA: formimidoylglutamase [Gemmataceae bacterium]|nr:formimidoylglutamase [Gemmataceae bacterium]